MSGDGTTELRAKRQKFEAMSSKAAREEQAAMLVKREMTKQAAVLVNQILLEQAAVEVNREMTPLPSCLWGTTAMCWCHCSGDLS